MICASGWHGRWPDARGLFVHDHTFRNPAVRHAACGELLRHDAPGDRAAGTGRGVLLHRELPLDDVGVRRRRAAAQHTRCGAGLSRVRPRPGQGGVLPSERCTGGVRADVAADHAHADGAAGAMPQLQGQAGQGPLAQPRPVRLPGVDGVGHFDLRLQRCAGWARPETTRRGHARHRHQVQPNLRGDVRDPGAADSRLGGGRARHGRPEDVQELRQHDRYFRRGKAAAQNHHALGHGQSPPGGAQVGRRQKHRRATTATRRPGRRG